MRHEYLSSLIMMRAVVGAQIYRALVRRITSHQNIIVR